MKKWFKRTLYTLLVLFLLFNIIIALQAYQATRFYEADPQKKRLQDMTLAEKLSAAFLGVKVHRTEVVDSLNLLHDNITINTEDSIRLSCWYINGVVKYKTAATGTVI